MNPTQLFDPDSSTYTYVLYDERTREALIIDPVDTQLERDLDTLLADGSLRLRGLEVFDFFPWTGHVETLAWRDREPDGPESLARRDRERDGGESLA